MTEQWFAAIRERWRDLEGAYPGMVHLDIATLLRMVEDRDAIIHDLMIDGAALARRAVEEFAAGLVEWVSAERQRHQMTTDFDAGAACALGVVQARIDEMRSSVAAHDPLPPDQVRAENERLRSALKAIRDQADGWINFVTITAPGQSPRRLAMWCGHFRRWLERGWVKHESASRSRQTVPVMEVK